MDLPEVHELEEAARRIVRDAHAHGELDSLTTRIVRAKLEQEFSLDDGSLREDPHKSAIKEALQEAVDEALAEQEKKPAKPTKAKLKKDKDKDKPEKKPRVQQKEAEVQNREKPKGKRKDFKSSEEVHDTSDEDENGRPSTSRQETTIDEPKPKRRKVEANSDNEDVKPPQTATTSKGPKSPKKSSSPVKPSKELKQEEALKSESELSVLIDEPPKPKKKATKEGGKTKKSISQGKSRSSNGPALSKDEETIKRLKSLVLACGVRKAWAKVFQGIDEPSQQIKKLKEILSDLGMTSRMSLEQAKSIRVKRELAQELEDVQTFQKAVQKQGRQSRSKSISEDEESEDDGKPVKRKTAHQSIMAFLGDQSESE